jgi:CBS domain-containing protein
LRMDADDRVRRLDEMPASVVARVLADLSPAERELTSLLLGYPPESAGRIMSPEYLTLRPEDTAEDAVGAIRRKPDGAETLSVLPVRDETRRLVGAVVLTELVRAPADAPIATVMDVGYPSVSAHEDQEPVARLIQEADLLLAFGMRFDFSIPPRMQSLLLATLPVVVAVKMATFYFSGHFHGWWRYVTFTDFIGRAVAVSAARLEQHIMLGGVIQECAEHILAGAPDFLAGLGILGLILAGIAVIVLNYMNAIPGGTQQHWLWVGLGIVALGFVAATRWR